MLCLSGFELYSRWVPLRLLNMAVVSSSFGTQFSQRQRQIQKKTRRSVYLEGSSVALKGCHRRKTTNEGKT